jgi:hypothetical protein
MTIKHALKPLTPILGLVVKIFIIFIYVIENMYVYSSQFYGCNECDSYSKQLIHVKKLTIKLKNCHFMIKLALIVIKMPL